MTRRNPGDERLRDLERRARQGDPDAQRALTAAQARRGDARAEADIMAEALRAHPTLDHRRAVMAAELGAFLDEHGVQALVEQRTLRSEPVKIPGRKATAPRSRVTLTYGFDGRWYLQHANIAYQGVSFSVRARATPAGDVDPDSISAFSKQRAITRWNEGSGMTDGGVGVSWSQNAIYFARELAREVATGTPAARTDGLANLDRVLHRGALPGDFFDWPFDKPMDLARFAVMLEASRGPALYRAFLADLYVFDLARFPADLAAMEDQRPFIEARAERAQQADRRFTGLR